MIILEILLSGIVQILLWVGAIVLVGVIIAFLNTLFYKVVGYGAYKVCVITGSIGTPVHELGHALFCVLFGHKIVEMKLYQPDSEDGTLGYVSHKFNPKNIYQKIGQFFIGVGPIILGSAVMFLLLFIMVRPTFDALTGLMSFFSEGEVHSASDALRFVVGGMNVFLGSFFSKNNIATVLWWLFVIIGCLISLHMRLSKSDIKGSLLGLALTVAVFGLVPVITGIISRPAMYVVNSAMTTGAVYVICVYMLSILLAALAVVIALSVKTILVIVKRIGRAAARRSAKA